MITKEQAMIVKGEFYMLDYTNRISRVRVSGQCKTWKTRPDDFRLPIKYGLYENSAVECYRTGEITLAGNWRRFFVTLEDAKAAHPNAPVQKGL